MTGVRWSIKATKNELINGAAIAMGKRSTSPGAAVTVEPSDMCKATATLRTTTILRSLAIADAITFRRSGRLFTQYKKSRHDTVQRSDISMNGNGRLKRFTPVPNSGDAQCYCVPSTPCCHGVNIGRRNPPEQQSIVPTGRTREWKYCEPGIAQPTKLAAKLMRSTVSVTGNAHRLITVRTHDTSDAQCGIGVSNRGSTTHLSVAPLAAELGGSDTFFPMPKWTM